MADILTKGTSPENIKEGSDWQTGPDWLVKDPSEWPVTEVKLTKEERDAVKGFESVSKVFKTVSHSVSSTSGPECQVITAEVRELHGGPDPSAEPDHGNEEKIDDVHWTDAIVQGVSSLEKIVKIVAHFRRLGGRHPLKLVENFDDVIQSSPVTANEYDVLLQMLVLHDRKDIEEKRYQCFDIEEFTLKMMTLKVLWAKSGVTMDVFPLPHMAMSLDRSCLICRTKILVKMSGGTPVGLTSSTTMSSSPFPASPLRTGPCCLDRAVTRTMLTRTKLTRKQSEDKMVRQILAVTVPLPSFAVSRRIEYLKNLVMNELKRHVNNLIVIAAADNSEIKALGGSVNL